MLVYFANTSIYKEGIVLQIADYQFIRLFPLKRLPILASKHLLITRSSHAENTSAIGTLSLWDIPWTNARAHLLSVQSIRYYGRQSRPISRW